LLFGLYEGLATRLPDEWKLRIAILKQRTKENRVLVESLLFLYMVLGFVAFAVLRKYAALRMFSQVHRSTRLKAYRAILEPLVVREISHLAAYQENIDPKRMERALGNRIMVLKAPRPEERGVLYIMFNHIIGGLPSVFDMQKLLLDYTLVFEPSWAGCCSEQLLQYTRYRDSIFVSCPEDEDFQFLTRIDSNLRPLGFGARDWVDPRIYEQYGGASNSKKFDVVMNSHWGWRKRHYVLFRNLREMPDVTAALIGVPFEGGTLDSVRALARLYGVEKQISCFERIKYEDVVRITASSKIGLLLSLKEGGNRAIPECLFCDIPVIVLSNNIGGAKNIVNQQTGIHSNDSDLSKAIRTMLRNFRAYSPRKWALENISCLVTTERLNNHLRASAVSCGQPWTCDIAPRTNAPESKYYHPVDNEKFGPLNQSLRAYFKA